MPVIYKDKAIVPAPLVNIVTNKDYAEDGSLLRTTFAITLTGKIFSYMGGLMNSGTEGRDRDIGIEPDERQNKIQEKQAALLDFFKQDTGKSTTDPGWMEVEGWDGGPSVIKFKPRFKSIDFKEGAWSDYVDYTVQLEADILSIGSIIVGEQPDQTSLEKQIQESWQVDQADDTGRTFKLSHSLSLSAKRFFDIEENQWKEGYDQAKKAIETKLKGNGETINNLGPDENEDLDTYFKGNIFGSSVKLYDYNVSFVSDEGAGKVSATETWLLYDLNNTADPAGTAPATEEFTIDISVGGENPFSAKISGTIKGLKTSDPNSRIDNAKSKWGAVKPNLKNRIQNYLDQMSYSGTISGADPEKSAVNRSIGINTNAGIITYSYEYQEKSLPAGVNVEDFIVFNTTVTRTNPIDYGAPRQYAVIPVLGRTAGPVVQALNSAPERGVTVQLDFIRQQPNRFVPPDVNIVYGIMQSLAGVNTLTSFEDSFSYTTGRYSATAKYIVAT